MTEIITLLSCIEPIIGKKIQKQLSIIIKAMLTMNGRITMLGLSRWSEKGGSYSTINRFFHSEIDWLKVNWYFIKKHMPKRGVFLLAGDEVVVTKSGKKTHGIGRFFSSIQNQVTTGISFLNLSIISVNSGKAWSIFMGQITNKNVKGCSKGKEKKKSKKSKSESKKEKNKAGRKEVSKNKDKKVIELSPYLNFVKKSISRVLAVIKKIIPITYFLFDGAFGNNNALQMVLQTGLHLISKLRRDSALYFEYKGDNKKQKYGDKIDYGNLPEEYLVEMKLEKSIITKIYQMKMRHKLFADYLNIVIIVKINIKNGRKAHVILFSSDLDLDYEKLIHYYSLRFQIEFIFRDAKQHWGLEDFMNVKEKAVHNFANLSTFMVNFSYGIRREFGNEKMSIINLKARFHGVKYLNEIIKLLPQKPDAILMNTLYQKITAIGAIDEEKRVA